MTTNSQVLLLITNKDKTGTKVTQSQGPGGEVKLTQSQHLDGVIKGKQSQRRNGIKLIQSQRLDGGIKVMQSQHQNGIKLNQNQHPDGGINHRNQIMTNMAQVRQIILQETKDQQYHRVLRSQDMVIINHHHQLELQASNQIIFHLMICMMMVHQIQVTNHL